MNPDGVRQMILDNFCGVRIDGTNATIIGDGKRAFIADRNNITRVWMDHAFWPFLTTMLYINQTGDIKVLEEELPYFKDRQVNRGNDKDDSWSEAYGVWQKTAAGNIYEGTVIEHLILQNMCAIREKGAHGNCRLRGADWNDAMDMAADQGESVTFTAAYAGNLRDIADLLERFQSETGKEELQIAAELRHFIMDEKHPYLQTLSGEKVAIKITEIVELLRENAEKIVAHIQENEWLGDMEEGWFNGYYDNHSQAVERTGENSRMILTSQVFPIMSKTASEEQVRAITKAADAYLYKKEAGGYRLNTNFNEEKYDLGRMFGFAYGEKENGAVFSHMTVMYANALYQRGFVREGYKALQSLLDASTNYEKSRMYPGIPEYFDAKGEGKYAYLTGAASWYMLTEITQAFGVRGEYGDLVIAPKLVKEQFDKSGEAALVSQFAGCQVVVELHNEDMLDWDAYKIAGAKMDGKELTITDEGIVRIPRAELAGKETVTVFVTLR